MKKQISFLSIVLLIAIFFGWTRIENNWIVDKQKGYTFYYTAADKENIDEYRAYFKDGKKTVEAFFQDSYKYDFGIYIHTSRSSLDSAWQKDWNMPDFKSQCWMVASGIFNKLDIISPKKWDSLSCEHSYADVLETQRLITHELVHVFHGQQNKSPDFNDISGIDWFIEGLAVYASGQCDSIRIAEVKGALSENIIPETLDKFWSGNLRYGLSGTVVLYLDKQFGTEKIRALLKYNKLEDLLNDLNITEQELLNGWRAYMNAL